MGQKYMVLLERWGHRFTVWCMVLLDRWPEYTCPSSVLLALAAMSRLSTSWLQYEGKVTSYFMWLLKPGSQYNAGGSVASEASAVFDNLVWTLVNATLEFNFFSIPTSTWGGGAAGLVQRMSPDATLMPVSYQEREGERYVCRGKEGRDKEREGGKGQREGGREEEKKWERQREIEKEKEGNGDRYCVLVGSLVLVDIGTFLALSWQVQFTILGCVLPLKWLAGLILKANVDGSLRTLESVCCDVPVVSDWRCYDAKRTLFSMKGKCSCTLQSVFKKLVFKNCIVCISLILLRSRPLQTRYSFYNL